MSAVADQWVGETYLFRGQILASFRRGALTTVFSLALFRVSRVISSLAVSVSGIFSLEPDIAVPA